MPRLRLELGLMLFGLLASCGDDDNGGVGPGVGAICGHHAECGTGHCCGKKECGGGMCTYQCRGDADCPGNMGCEHGVCFFACASDAQCAPGEKCKHGGVCEFD